MRIALYTEDAPLDGDVVVIPPGLTAPLSAEALGALGAFARAGGRILALGDAVALLCAADLLPGAIATDAALPGPTHLRVEGRATPFTWAIPAGRILALPGPAAHRYLAPEADVAALAARGRIVLRYCDSAGGLADGKTTVAGLCDESGRVVGILSGVSPALDCPLGAQVRACLARA